MIARTVNHVSFAIADLDRSLAFYRDLLGLKPIPRPDLPVGGAWLGVGDAQVHLIVVPPGTDVGGPPPQLNPIACHTAFSIADYGGTLAALRARGLDVLETTPEMGQMWVRDPDGYIIELIAR
jgi:glyoxylase I family protein